MLGLTYDDGGVQTMAMFAELEDRRTTLKTSPNKSSRSIHKQTDGGSRELKHLECYVNYERKPKKSNIGEGFSSSTDL